MKPGESFKLTESWWKAGKPGNLTETGLSNALRIFDAADHKFQGDHSIPNFLAVTKALDGVNTARLGTIQKCGSNEKLKDVKAALAKDGAITQRKAVLKAAMAAEIDKKIQEIEQKLAAETERVKRTKQKVDEIEAGIEAARQANDGKQLTKLGKEFGPIAENTKILSGMLCMGKANSVLVEISQIAAQFPAHVARLKEIKAASQANNVKIREIVDLANDNRAILVND